MKKKGKIFIMKDVEKLLNITGSEEIEIPTCIESKIQNTINNLNEKKNHNLIKQVLKYIIWSIIGICSCGTVYAIHYIDKHSNIYDVGVKDAIQNGYVQEIENVKYNIDNNVKNCDDRIIKNQFIKFNKLIENKYKI